MHPKHRANDDENSTTDRPGSYLVGDTVLVLPPAGEAALDADALADRIGDTVAAVSGPGGVEERVEFDIFSGQTGGEWSSWCDVTGGVVTAGLIRLPAADSTVDTFVQLRNFLGDVPLLTRESVATVYEDVPHLIYDTPSDTAATAPAGRWAALAEESWRSTTARTRPPRSVSTRRRPGSENAVSLPDSAFSLTFFPFDSDPSDMPALSAAFVRDFTPVSTLSLLSGSR